jgi:hypothetical protein
MNCLCNDFTFVLIFIKSVNKIIVVKQLLFYLCKVCEIHIQYI